ncbi:MAG: hypothetical protein KKI08_16240 [Armatimonadetes bacterium]|nr:hypothetical protein [Armatimonadota bacterium]
MTDKLQELRDVALRGGARAGKVCGAGGGGCVLFLSQPDREGAVRKALREVGGQVIDFSFDFRGLVVWEVG